MSDGRLGSGLCGPGDSIDGEEYSPGGKGFPEQLCLDIAACYLDGSLHSPSLGQNDNSLQSFVRGAGLIKSLLEGFKPEEREANSLIDAVLFHAYAQRPAAQEYQHSAYALLDHLLSPLIQALYETGSNGFRVELPPHVILPHAAWFLHGTADDMLRLSIKGSTNWSFGKGVDHCSLELEGDAPLVGNAATGSVFVSSAGRYAFHCEGCEFHVHAKRFSLAEDPERCSFYLHEGMGEMKVESLLTDGFLQKGNRLLVPDGSGCWTEVRE